MLASTMLMKHVDHSMRLHKGIVARTSKNRSRSVYILNGSGASSGEHCSGELHTGPAEEGKLPGDQHLATSV